MPPAVNCLWFSADGPKEDACDEETGAVDRGGLLIAGGQAAPLLGTFDATFDSVPSLVILGSNLGGRPPCELRFLRFKCAAVHVLTHARSGTSQSQLSGCAMRLFGAE